MSQPGPRAALLDFLRTVIKPGSTLDGMADETNLVQAGLLDSFALIQVIYYLEQNHQLDLHALRIDPADLVSVRGMLAAIARAA